MDGFRPTENDMKMNKGVWQVYRSGEWHDIDTLEEEDMGKFQKFDGDKPLVTLVEPSYIIGTAKVLTFGANKYGRDNWKTAKPEDIQRYKDAIFRHLLAYLDGETIDPESKMPHLDHISCNAMFLRHFDMEDML